MNLDHSHLMKSEQVFDDFQNKDQAVINCEVYNKLKELEDSKGEDYIIVDSLPSKPDAGDEDRIYLVPTEEEGVYDSYKWDQRVAGWASQGQIEVPDSAIVLTKEEGDKFYQKKLIPGTGIAIDEDGNIRVTLDTSIFKPVSSLPDAPAEEDRNKIFLIANASEEEGNFYDEYIWAVNDEHPDGYWEKIGSAKIDLSGYLTEEAADEKYQPIASPEDPYVKKSELPDLDGYIKVEEVDGKKVLVLPESVQIMGTIGTAIYALLSLRTYNQESGESITQVEVGTTSYHLNLNSLDNVTVDTPEGKKTLVFSEDLSNFLKIITVDGKEIVNLPQNVQLMGTVRDAIYALVSLRVYNEGTDEEIIQVEIGTISQHLNLNTQDNITYDTPEGKKVIANLDDLKDNLKIVEVNGKKVVILPESVQIMGTIGEAIYALVAIQKYAQEEGADLIQVEVGTTSFHLNLNTADNITYDTPDGKKTLVNLDDLADYVKIIEVSGKKVISLPENVQITGTIADAIYALLSLRKYEDGTEQVELGTTSKHLNLNTSDDITYDTPTGKKTLATDEVATSEKKGLLSSEDKAKLDKVDLDTFIIDLSNSDEAKKVHLALVEKYKDITEAQPVQNVYVKNQNKVGLVGKTNLIPITGVAIKSGSPHFFCDLTVQFQFGELPSQSCFGNLEFYFSEDGTASYQVSNTLINSGGKILNYQDGGLVAKAALKYVSGLRGKVQLTGIDDEVISELDADLYAIPWRIDLPIRSPLNKVFEESEILEWFHVESISELKTVVNTRNLYMKYGILLTGKPMYYNMQIHYAAFESNTQVKLVWVGLDTSNDAATKYTLIINLDGTVIENGSNVSLKLESFALKSEQDSYIVVDELTEDYIVPANPAMKNISYEIHVGSEVHNISAVEDIRWQNNEIPEIHANHVYVVSVMNNLATWGEF